MDVLNVQSSSASGRSVIFSAAISDWRHHPIFGLGTGSFNFGAASGQPHPWLPNLTLLALHDTGLVGLTILVLLVAAFYLGTASALRSNGDFTHVVVGAVAGFTSLLVAFQTTTGFWFAYPWIVAAVGIAAARLQRQARGSG
jgi:O-antigen ligase